jgi:hypothetical protein
MDINQHLVVTMGGFGERYSFPPYDELRNMYTRGRGLFGKDTLKTRAGGVSDIPNTWVV